MNPKHNIPKALEAIQLINQGMCNLKDLGIIRSQKFVGDLGEWVVSSLYDGTLAKSKSQAGWDVQTPSELIQVKSHAKAKSNKTRWSKYKKEEVFGEYDAWVIVIFTEFYKIKEIYKIPKADLQQIMCKTNKMEKMKLNWNDLGPWHVPKETFIHMGPITEMFE